MDSNSAHPASNHTPEPDSGHAPAASIPSDSDQELIAFLWNRSAPCPRCNYDLRNIRSAQCPECGEPLVLKVGSPRARFGWLIVAMVPGSFSGVAALFVLVPIVLTLLRGVNSRQDLPIPFICADLFGFLSVASVAFMYKHRHKLMARSARWQGIFAACIWAAHIAAFGLLVLSMWLLY